MIIMMIVIVILWFGIMIMLSRQRDGGEDYDDGDQGNQNHLNFININLENH